MRKLLTIMLFGAMLFAGSVRAQETKISLPESLCFYPQASAGLSCGQMGTITVSGQTYSLSLSTGTVATDGTYTGTIAFTPQIAGVVGTSIKETIKGTVGNPYSGSLTGKFTGPLFNGSIDLDYQRHTSCSRYCHVYWVEFGGELTLTL